MTYLYVVQESSGWEFGDIVAVFNSLKWAKEYVETASGTTDKAYTHNHKTWICGHFQISKIEKPYID